MAMHPLLDWLESPAEHHGLHVMSPDERWTFHSYQDLARMVFASAERLRSERVLPGDGVAIALESGPEFTAGLFGVLAVGATPIPLAPPGRLRSPAHYRQQLEGILRASQPRALITGDSFLRAMDAPDLSALVSRHITVDLAELARADSPVGKIDRPEHALSMFTSGSSGPPKGLKISLPALEANIESIRQWLEMTPDDATATWLPLYHDMGLIGCFLTPVVNGSDLWIMTPDNFIRSPLNWLSCFGLRRARLTASPNFGLEHVLRRVTADQLEGQDFTDWRALILGAERINPIVLDRFHDLLAAHGFRRRTYLPAYGLAEATLAVTGVEINAEPRVVTVDPRSLNQGGRISIQPADSALEPAMVSLVGCGRPLGGNTVTVVDVDNALAGDGHLGEIVVTSPSAASEYLGDGGSRTSTTITRGIIRTGDAGMLLDGELFVVGRLGDSVKIRGRAIFADDLEVLVATLPGLHDTRPIVVLGTVDGVDSVAVIVRRAPGDWMRQAAELLRRETEGMRVMICTHTRGVTPRTTSGKPRRRPLWAALLRRELDVAAVFDGDAAGSTQRPQRI
jgi:acyl-CoA synthetase (AMP-forming)/AMP-acid ligase II